MKNPLDINSDGIINALDKVTVNGNPATVGALGGAQGWILVRIPVTAGETLRFYVGGRGGNGSLTSPAGGVAGYNGGGSGASGVSGAGSLPGGGGGGTDVRRLISGVWTRLAAAAGGGGAGGNGGSNHGGDGGGRLTGSGKVVAFTQAAWRRRRNS